MASTIEETKEASTKLTQNLATHFALLAFQQRYPSTSKLLEMGYSVFIDAVVDASTQRVRVYAKAATIALDAFAAAMETLCKGDRVRMAALSVWDEFSDRFCDLCKR